MRQGRPVGAQLFMTPARVERVKRRLIKGDKIIDIATDLGISRQTLYTRFSREKIRRLKAAWKRTQTRKRRK